MNADELRAIRLNAQSDYPPLLCNAVRDASTYFAQYLDIAPRLRRLRLQAIYALRQMGWTIAEISNATGLDEDRITELLKLDRRRRKRDQPATDDPIEGGTEDPE